MLKFNHPRDKKPPGFVPWETSIYPLLVLYFPCSLQASLQIRWRITEPIAFTRPSSPSHRPNRYHRQPQQRDRSRFRYSRRIRRIVRQISQGIQHRPTVEADRRGGKWQYCPGRKRAGSDPYTEVSRCKQQGTPPIQDHAPCGSHAHPKIHVKRQKGGWMVKSESNCRVAGPLQSVDDSPYAHRGSINFARRVAKRKSNTQGVESTAAETHPIIKCRSRGPRPAWGHLAWCKVVGNYTRLDNCTHRQ